MPGKKLPKPKPKQKTVHLRTVKPLDPDQRLKVGDMVITDEYTLADHRDNGRKLAELILMNPDNALLVQKGKRVVGIVTTKSILQAVVDGKDLDTVNAIQLMSRDVMYVSESDALEDILPEIFDNLPLAVVVTNARGEFVGYFSPEDCMLAAERLKFYQDSAA